MANAVPLADVADRWLADLARAAGGGPTGVGGAALLGERAALNGFRMPGRVSAGGGCRLYDAADGTVALNLAREDDRDLLPALFGGEAPEDIAAGMSGEAAAPLVARGRLLGLAIAHDAEAPPPAIAERARAAPAAAPTGRPRVLDLSALWAGPLACHLLQLAGSDVVRVENPRRRDNMRCGDAALFALLNGAKPLHLLDPADPDDRLALLDLIARSDIVVESARPRALRRLGIDADALVRARPGLTWVNITAHGAAGDAADWIGFGDDCAVAAGLTAALRRATGRTAFVGDAIADPLTGVAAARAAWASWAAGGGVRLGLAMSGVVAQAMAETRDLTADLRAWAAADAFPAVRRRAPAPNRAATPC